MVNLSRKTLKLMGAKADSYDFQSRMDDLEDQVYDTVDAYYRMDAVFHDLRNDIILAIDEATGNDDLSAKYIKVTRSAVEKLKNPVTAKVGWDHFLEVTRQFQRQYGLSLGLD